MGVRFTFINPTNSKIERVFWKLVELESHEELKASGALVIHPPKSSKACWELLKKELLYATGELSKNCFCTFDGAAVFGAQQAERHEGIAQDGRNAINE